jgi:hypothetical protein
VTSELEQIAASVAKALGLGEPNPAMGWQDSDRRWLTQDGSNVFEPYWRCRCLDWLLEHGYLVSFSPIPAAHVAYKDGTGDFRWYGPASEFPARAINALMEKTRDL